MMKKILPLVAVAAGLVMSAQAHATGGYLAQSGNLTPNPSGTNVCEAIYNDITVQLSNGVLAAWNCSTNSFVAGTCHQSGSNKEQTIPCSYTEWFTYDIDGNETGHGFDKSANQCPDHDPNAVEQATSATFTGRIGFKGGSGGGKVGAAQLEDTTACNAASVKTLVGAQ